MRNENEKSKVDMREEDREGKGTLRKCLQIKSKSNWMQISTQFASTTGELDEE